MALHLYGIANCDKVRTARGWLEKHGLDYIFADLRASGGKTLTAPLLDGWIAALGWESLVNRRSATWRALPESERTDLSDSRARTLLLAHPTLLKRPVLTGISPGGETVLEVGFAPERYHALLGPAGKP